MMLILPVLTAFCLVVFASPAHSRTWYVKPDSTGDAPTIQAAIDSATAGDDVLLAPGLYNYFNQGPWPNYQGMIRMKSGIWLHSESGPEVTILDASVLGGRVIYCSSVAGGATIEGLTISGGGEAYVGGGGVYCHDSDVIIRKNVFFDNYTSSVWLGVGEGGGVYCVESDGEITGNTFIANRADEEGSAIGCAASSSPTISRNIIAGSLGSPALFCDVSSAPLVACNAFWDNEAGNGNCAMGPDNFTADPLFCDIESGDYGLHEDSPCAPNNSPAGCGLIGALPVSCWGAPIGSLATIVIALGTGAIGLWRASRKPHSQHDART